MGINWTQKSSKKTKGLTYKFYTLFVEPFIIVFIYGRKKYFFVSQLFPDFFDEFVSKSMYLN